MVEGRVDVTLVGLVGLLPHGGKWRLPQNAEARDQTSRRSRLGRKYHFREGHFQIYFMLRLGLVLGVELGIKAMIRLVLLLNRTLSSSFFLFLFLFFFLSFFSFFLFLVLSFFFLFFSLTTMQKLDAKIIEKNLEHSSSKTVFPNCQLSFLTLGLRLLSFQEHVAFDIDVCSI